MDKNKVDGPSAVADAVARYGAGLDDLDRGREHYFVFLLNSQNVIVDVDLVAKGGRACCYIEPLQVFRKAVYMNSGAIISAHTHPSGSVVPSSEDMDLTRALVDGGALLGITMMDHVVVDMSTGHYYSMLEAGTLPRPERRLKNGNKD